MDKPNLFDQKIRDAINKYDVPFDDTAWKNIESKINASPSSPTITWRHWLISAAAAASLVVAYFVFYPTSETKTNLVKQEKIESTPNNKQLPVIESTSSEENKDIENVNVQEEKSNAPIKRDEKTIPAQEKEADLIIEKEEKASIEKIVLKENASKKEIQNSEVIKDIENDNLNLDIHITEQTICLNEALVISLSQSNVPVELNWDFGDGTTAEGSSIMHRYNEAGTYLLTLSARSVLNEELVEKTSYPIRVNQIPTANFEIDLNDNMVAFPKVSFTSLCENESSIEWVFNDETIRNNEVVEKVFNNKGNYNIALIARNQFQCTDTSYHLLSIENDFNLLAPNAFSPNGDGINDTFIPEAIPYLNQEFTMQVFDTKSGQLIFETSNFEIPWNGNYMNNGEKLNEGAYAWSVKTEDGLVYKGTILITTK